MGLDQYAFSFKPRKEIAVKINRTKIVLEESKDLNKRGVDFKEPSNARQIWTWRKHPNLQGWMDNLYILKGGSTRE